MPGQPARALLALRSLVLRGPPDLIFHESDVDQYSHLSDGRAAAAAFYNWFTGGVFDPAAMADIKRKHLSGQKLAAGLAQRSWKAWAQ